MKIITLNCWLPPWSLDRDKRLPFIFSALLNENPDIIFLQEVFSKNDAEFLIIKLKENGFEWSFHSKGLLFLSKYPITSHEMYKLSSRGSLFSWAILDRLYKNVYQILKVNINGELITCVNLHLLGPYHSTETYRIIREKQIVEICQNLSKELGKIIMAGDFNFGLYSSGYKIITKRFDFIDPLEYLNLSTFSNSNINIKQKPSFAKNMEGKSVEQWIDHIFTKGFRKKAEGRVIFTEKYMIGVKKKHISDHFGLLLNID